MAKAKSISASENSKKALAIHKQANKNVSSAKDSTIKSMLGMTKTIKIAEGTPQEYSLTLKYPGIARASQIEDDIQNPFGNVSFSALMSEAIKYIIISPKIKSVSFWDTHVNYAEVALKVNQFLNEGINCQLQQ